MKVWEWILELISNEFILTGAAAWLLAQVVKTIIHAVINKKIVFERLIGDGGMPSAHSATVSSLAAFSAWQYGPGSFQFAVTMFLAIIVCHDAMGVRLETGKQAKILNELTALYETLAKKDLPETKLKEFVGHTPIQVIAGILTGCAVAAVMHFLVFA